MSNLSFANAAEYAAATKVAKPGDLMVATANMALGSDLDIPAGVTLDLDGHALTAPPPSIEKPRGFRFLRIVGDNTTVQNGTIDNAGWGVFTPGSAKGVTIRNLKFTNVRMAAIKLSPISGVNETMVDGIVIEDVTVSSIGHPDTLMDLGPGPIGTLSVKRVNITGPPIDPAVQNTACDGFGVEDGRGPIVIDDITIDGAPGDGLDVKNTTDLSINKATILNVNRNGLKIWCHSTLKTGVDTPTARAVVTNLHTSGCGLEAVAVAAGDVTITDSVIESPTMCANFGNGTINGCRVHVKRTAMKRTGPGVNGIILTDGGNSQPILSDPVQVDFTDCSVDPGWAPNIFLVKAGSPMAYVTAEQARDGKWPPNWVNCTVGSALPPVVDPPVVDPPVVTPPPVPVPTDLAKLQAQVTSLSAKLDLLTARSDAKWAALLSALQH